MMSFGGGSFMRGSGIGSSMRGGSSTMYRDKPQFTVSPWVTSRRIARYLAVYRGNLFGALICVVFSSGLQMLMPLAFKHVIDVTIPGGNPTELLWIGL